MDEQAKTEIGLALGLFLSIAGVVMGAVCYIQDMVIHDVWKLIVLLIFWVAFCGWAIYQFCKRNG